MVTNFNIKSETEKCNLTEKVLLSLRVPAPFSWGVLYIATYLLTLLWKAVYQIASMTNGFSVTITINVVDVKSNIQYTIYNIQYK